MFSFIKKIEVENIPIVRAFFIGLSTFFVYSLLLWLISIAHFNWIVVPIAFIGVISSALTSLFEDMQTLKCGEYKNGKVVHFFSFLNLTVFWSLIFYLCFNIALSHFTLCLICLAAVFTFIRTLSASFMLPSLMDSIKQASNINEKYKDQKVPNWETMKELEDMAKSLKKKMSKAFVFAFFPSVLGIVFLWWAFYRVFVQMNVSVEVVVYVIFVILFETILSNFTKALKKELINKVIGKSHE